MVFMVMIGILGHFALGQQIPAVLSEFIDGLANSFGGAALFYLGLTMVSLPILLHLHFLRFGLVYEYDKIWKFSSVSLLIWQVGQLRKLTRDTGVALILLITAKL